MKIHCEEFRSWFEEYFDGTLPDELRVACDAHLAECPRCHQFDQAHRRVDEILFQLPRETAPAGFTQRVMARWTEERRAPSLFERIREYLQSSRLVILSEAAALAILVIGGYYFYNFQTPAGGTAASNGAISTAMPVPPKRTAQPAGTAAAVQPAPASDGQTLARVATPVQEEIVIPGAMAQAADPPVTQTASFDRYIAAVSEGPPAPQLHRGDSDALNFWGIHDIRKGMREAQTDSIATSHYVFQKLFDASDYRGVSGAALQHAMADLFERHDGQLLVTQTQSSSSGSAMIRFQGWVGQRAWREFQNALVEWTPGAQSGSKDVARSSGFDDSEFFATLPAGPGVGLPSAAQSPPSARVSVTVILSFQGSLEPSGF